MLNASILKLFLFVGGLIFICFNTYSQKLNPYPKSVIDGVAKVSFIGDSALLDFVFYIENKDSLDIGLLYSYFAADLEENEAYYVEPFIENYQCPSGGYVEYGLTKHFPLLFKTIEKGDRFEVHIKKGFLCKQTKISMDFSFYLFTISDNESLKTKKLNSYPGATFKYTKTYYLNLNKKKVKSARLSITQIN